MHVMPPGTVPPPLIAETCPSIALRGVGMTSELCAQALVARMASLLNLMRRAIFDQTRGHFWTRISNLSQSAKKSRPFTFSGFGMTTILGVLGAEHMLMPELISGAKLIRRTR